MYREDRAVHEEPRLQMPVFPTSDTNVAGHQTVDLFDKFPRGHVEFLMFYLWLYFVDMCNIGVNKVVSHGRFGWLESRCGGRCGDR